MVKVAIIDSGLDLRHEKLKGLSVEAGKQFIPCKHGIEETDNYLDDNGHGTAISGIIYSKAPRAKQIIVKILNRNLASRGDVLTKGIEWATGQGADIINISADTNGGNFKPQIEEAVNYAVSKNVLIVSSLGRNGPQSIPAALNGVQSVDGAFFEDLNQYITCNDGIPKYLAPGIQQVLLGLNNGYNFRGGSSFACAHITGIAVKLATEKNIKGVRLKKELEKKGTRLNSLQVKRIINRLSCEEFDNALVKGYSDIYKVIISEIQKISRYPINISSSLLDPGLFPRDKVWPLIKNLEKKLKIKIPTERINGFSFATPYSLGNMVLKLIEV